MVLALMGYGECFWKICDNGERMAEGGGICHGGKCNMDKWKMRQSLLLLLTAAIWGAAFVAQSVGMDYVEPLTFNCIRSLLGG